MVESRPPANPLFLRDEELRQGIELMFYAYRDFTFESDQQLRRYQLGRAHHRALYFIGRHPGQTVGHLLSILKVTKQSISRVLKDLLEQGYARQTDEVIYQLYGKDKEVEFTGVRGTIIAEDSKGYHKGKLPTKGDRSHRAARPSSRAGCRGFRRTRP